MAEEKPVLTLKFAIDASALPDPLGANYVGLSRLSDDFVLQVGWMNVPQLVDELIKPSESARELTVVPHITHQFFMTRSGFLQLYRQVNSFADKMRAQGVLKDSSEADEE